MFWRTSAARGASGTVLANWVGQTSSAAFFSGGGSASAMPARSLRTSTSGTPWAMPMSSW